MAEVPFYSIVAPVYASKKYGQLQPLVPGGFRLADLPDSHRVYTKVEGGKSLYLKRGTGDNFFRYLSYDSAIRATQHIIDRDKRAAVLAKYTVLGTQLSALHKERILLEQAEVDVQELDLEIRELQRHQAGVITRAEALKSQLQQFTPSAEDSAQVQTEPVDSRQIEDPLPPAAGLVASLYATLKVLLKRNPLDSHPGLVLVPYLSY